jgi:NAD+ synthase
MFEYFHADRLVYAVVGTPNRLEYDQGFFVKLGDGAADVKPIAHLYKTQVYALAEHLGLPDEIRSRPPTTDTYPLSQDQEEFYFAVPHATLDLFIAAVDRGLPASAVAGDAGLSEEDVARVFADIEAKRRVAHYLHREPLLAAPL